MRSPGLGAEACFTLASMQLPASLPPSHGNAKADDEQAALLGFSLFFDARLSAGQDMRCASCHMPERAFTDGRQTALGLEAVERNSPSIYTAAWHRWQMWDGRADSLWSQPLLALENEKEMRFTRLELAHRLQKSYRPQYEAIFGALPSGLALWPTAGKPGDPAFDTLPAVEQFEVNRIAANAGKAIEAYMREAAHGRGRFDEYLGGASEALTVTEKRGLAVFFSAGCAACHGGPGLSDDGFHDIAVPPNDGKPVERGRAAVISLLAVSPFRANGPFHDGTPVEQLLDMTAKDEHAYRTPSLRNVARTGPWGHNGHFATLEEAVDFHLAAQGQGTELKHVPVTSDERAALLAFLRALDAGDPASPWNNWPDR